MHRYFNLHNQITTLKDSDREPITDPTSQTEAFAECFQDIHNLDTEKRTSSTHRQAKSMPTLQIKNPVLQRTLVSRNCTPICPASHLPEKLIPCFCGCTRRPQVSHCVPYEQLSDREGPGDCHPIRFESIVCKMMGTVLKGNIPHYLQQTAEISGKQKKLCNTVPAFPTFFVLSSEAHS